VTARPACTGDSREALVKSFSRRHGLSDRQGQVLSLAAVGLARKEAAAVLSCSPKTVEEHWRRICHKTRCRSATEVLASLLRVAADGWLRTRSVLAPSRRPRPADGAVGHVVSRMGLRRG
jgi:DNA-binding CsgD family transcriptional regulator